jgi:hypothetical protein
MGPSEKRRRRLGLNSAMADTPPIACTLSAADLEDREGAAAALIDLIDLERECCAWIRFDVGDQSVVTPTAGGEGEVAEMFR